MGSEWKSVRLVDITSKLGDGLHGTPKYSPDGDYHFINGNNLLNGVIAFDEKTKRIDHSEFLKYQKELNSRTILVSINGTIGNIAFYNGEKVVLGKSACYFNIVDSVDKEFIRYVLADHGFQRYIEAFATGTTIKNVSLKTMREFEFKLPEIHEQKGIAQILASLDHKITLNRQLNQTLEHMAQALFKSWFVDFDPVIDNALAAGRLGAGHPIPDELQDRAERRQLQLAKADHKPLPENIRKLFPSEFELTESLGRVPKGWGATSIASAILVNPRVSLPKGKVAKFADMKALPTYGFSINEVIEKEFSGGAKFQQNDVLVARITPCLENGKTGLVDFLLENEAGFGSTEFIVLREKSHIKYPFVACLSRDDNFRKHCMQSMVGSSGRQRVQNACFDSYFIAIPERNEILDLFTNITLPNFVKMTSCKNEIESLSQLRDTLLPKLISGELRIPEAQAQLEAVLG